jgi:hypothetical protein
MTHDQAPDTSLHGGKRVKAVCTAATIHILSGGGVVS